MEMKDGEKNCSSISKIAGERWRRLPCDQQQRWCKEAEIAKARHALMYPAYKYQPGPKRAKRKRTRRTASSEDSSHEVCFAK